MNRLIKVANDEMYNYEKKEFIIIYYSNYVGNTVVFLFDYQ